MYSPAASPTPRLNCAPTLPFSEKSKRIQLGVREPQAVKEEKYDYVVIAIENRAVISHVEEALLEMGVPKERIVFANELQ